MQKSIYQLKISLVGSRPLIWRRFLVSNDITFKKLHSIIQVVMGWYDYHLYEFIIDGTSITDPETIAESFDKDAIDCETTKICEFIKYEKQKILYIYDFGDGWEHNITVEKILSDNTELEHSICLDGKLSCPPEDCGGLGGYYYFLKAIRDKNHPKHKDMLEWIGGEFDPNEFYLDIVNQDLKRIKI